MILIVNVNGIFMCLNPGDIVREHYRIVTKLGKGGFGITYKAQDTREEENKVLVALKQIPIPQQNENGEVRGDRYVEDLEREANTLRNLRHDRIPKFIDKFRENNYFYIVQEYIPGHSLKEEIIPGRRIDQSEIVKMLRETLEILRFVHRNNIIHRDIKPANLIRREADNKIVLIDFGAVKEVETINQNSFGASITRILGTPGYVPNEQAIGNPQFNSDIYALGIIILQTITDFSINEIYNSDLEPKIDNQCNYIWEHEAYPEVSQGLKRIISKMIKYNFQDGYRYQTVKEVLEDLDRLKAGEEIIIDPEKETNINFLPESNQSEIIKAGKSTNNNSRKILFAITIIFFCTLTSFTYGKWYSILAFINPACDSKTEDYISCGEEILYPHSKDVNRKRAAEHFSNNQYQEALRYFKKSWTRRREAETLIYMNNSLLQAIDADYYTLMVAVPLSYEGITAKNYELSQDFLRGVAQAQTQVNLTLLDSNPEVKDILPGQDFLREKIIKSGHKPRGLRIVIVDDRNSTEHTKVVARNIASKSEIFGVIGHYASDKSLSAGDEYLAKNLSQVSFGTTTVDLTENPKSNFFRVVYTNYEEADAIIDSINKLDISDKKIAVFYNPASTYSSDFWGEINKRIEEQNKQLPLVKQIKISKKKFNLADNKNFNTRLALREVKSLKANIFILLPDGQESDALANAIDLIEKDNGETAIISGNPVVNPKIEEIKTAKPLKLIASSFWHYLNDPESKFTKNSQKLWGVEKIQPGTYTTYDATLVLIEAIRQQENPTRKGTLNKISERGFSILGSTGHIQFNTPQNGDRLNFPATIVKLCNIDNQNIFKPVNKDINKKQNLCV